MRHLNPFPEESARAESARPTPVPGVRSLVHSFTRDLWLNWLRKAPEVIEPVLGKKSPQTPSRLLFSQNSSHLSLLPHFRDEPQRFAASCCQRHTRDEKSVKSTAAPVCKKKDAQKTKAGQMACRLWLFVSTALKKQALLVRVLRRSSASRCNRRDGGSQRP